MRYTKNNLKDIPVLHDVQIESITFFPDYDNPKLKLYLTYHYGKFSAYTITFHNTHKLNLDDFRPYGASPLDIRGFGVKQREKNFEIGKYFPPRVLELIEFEFEIDAGDYIVVLAESVEITQII